MNRFKKELRKRGYKLEQDFECLPTPGGIEAVTVDAERATWAIYHVSAGWASVEFNRAFEGVESWED